MIPDHHQGAKPARQSLLAIRQHCPLSLAPVAHLSPDYERFSVDNGIGDQAMAAIFMSDPNMGLCINIKSEIQPGVWESVLVEWLA